MRRADRLFQIITILSRRRFATAQDLAEALEVSPRTVYRDIQDLSVSGVPILGEAGVGYQLDPSYRLPPLTFNTDEVERRVAPACRSSSSRRARSRTTFAPCERLSSA
jgi:predicted DNA-binding transcriptional regulator YafY